MKAYVPMPAYRDGDWKNGSDWTDSGSWGSDSWYDRD